MIFVIQIQNLMKVGPAVSELICLTKIETDGAGGQADRLKHSETHILRNGNGRPIFSYSWGHDPSRKYESNQSPNGLDYNTSLACAHEAKKQLARLGLFLIFTN